MVLLRDDPDSRTRTAAFQALERMVARHGPTLRWEVIEQGFELDGQRLYLATRARGIFRPKEMRGGALSVKTIIPRGSRLARYQDEPLEDGAFAYKLQGEDPDGRDNLLLQQAWEMGAPLIYFYAVDVGVYQPLWPVFIQEIDRAGMVCRLSVDDGALVSQERRALQVADARAIEIRRQYVTVQARRRVHQARFRVEVLRAYEERCAVCRLPGEELLEASHIVPDREEAGVPEVPNGLSLCRLHHGVFDTDLMGIRPDGVIELAPRLLQFQDGPTLEHAIKAFHGRTLHFPRRSEQQPGRQYLEQRYERFRAAG